MCSEACPRGFPKDWILNSRSQIQMKYPGRMLIFTTSRWQQRDTQQSRGLRGGDRVSAQEKERPRGQLCTSRSGIQTVPCVLYLPKDRIFNQEVLYLFNLITIIAVTFCASYIGGSRTRPNGKLRSAAPAPTGQRQSCVRSHDTHLSFSVTVP